MGTSQSVEASLAVRCYSDREAAELLSCSRRHVVNLRARGELKFVKIGKRIVIRHSDLLAFLEANQKGGWAERGSADAA
jgi:excisionase family DNA binding protein